MNPLHQYLRQMTWLIRRELWEARWFLLGAPMLLSALSMILSMVPSFLRPQGHDAAFYDEVVRLAPRWLGPNGSPAFWIAMGIAITFYAVHALHDERRERSVLFWKSLPITDLQTVLSKVVVALLIVPACALLFELAFQAIRLAWLAVEMSSNGFDQHAATLLSPSTYTLLAPSILHYVTKMTLWSLPNVAWLLMISAWARSKPLLWALTIPVMAWIVVGASAFSLGASLGFSEFFKVWVAIPRLISSVFPVLQTDATRAFMAEQSIKSDFESLDPEQLVWGMVAGIAMLAMAVRLRRRNADI